jgi:hypothetical protein
MRCCVDDWTGVGGGLIWGSESMFHEGSGLTPQKTIVPLSNCRPSKDVLLTFIIHSRHCLLGDSLATLEVVRRKHCYCQSRRDVAGRSAGSWRAWMVDESRGGVRSKAPGLSRVEQG